MAGPTVYLCEKPDQARKIAAGLGAPAPKGGYIETGGGALVTWGFGHLLSPKMPEDYDESLKAWNWDTLPIVPERFEFKPREGGARKQLRIIADLFKRAGEIVVATDPDREGELIAYEILTQMRWKGPVKRLWLSDLTPSAIKKALGELKEGDETKPLYFAALARTCADWLVGLNMTRAATLKLRSGGGKPISIGRVQTPTLALIVRLERKILNFKPEDYYELTAEMRSAEGHAFKLRHAPAPEKRIMDKAIAEKMASQATGATGPLSVTTEEKRQGPPPLFDLNLLQQEANGRFAWPADKTLKVAQALYETHEILTYPRTDSSALPEDHKNRIPQILTNLFGIDELAHLEPAMKEPVLRDTVYDDKKVSAHHAIVPTLKAARMSALSKDEADLYLLVARRFMAAHLPDHRYRSTIIEFDARGIPFRASGRVPTFDGWKAAFAGLPEEDKESDEKEAGEEDEENMGTLPPVNDGEQAKAESVAVNKKTTQAPKRFTEKTLLKAMKNVAQYVDDEAARKRLKQTSGIGTPATRANIIETIKTRGYIATKKRQIAPTDVGMGVIDALEASIPAYCDPVLTAAWEDVLEDIATRKAKTGEFVAAIASTVRKDVLLLKDKEGLKTVGGDAPARGAQGPKGPRLSVEQRAKALADGTPLKVPFEKKDKAKQLGAVWNPDKKVWMVPPNADLEPFRAAGWLPKG